MIGILVGVAVFIGMLINGIKAERKSEMKERREKDRGSYVIVAVVSLTTAALAWAVTELLMYFPARWSMIETTQSSELIKSEEIISLRDTSALDGNFFLGCGSVGEDEWYVYYTETEYGYKKNKVSADNSARPVYLKYISEGESPRIDEYGWVTRKVLKDKSFFLSLFGYIKLSQYNVGDEISATYSEYGLGGGKADDRRYEIYIPEGSIKEDYVVDME